MIAVRHVSYWKRTTLGHHLQRRFGLTVPSTSYHYGGGPGQLGTIPHGSSFSNGTGTKTTGKTAKTCFGASTGYKSPRISLISVNSASFMTMLTVCTTHSLPCKFECFQDLDRWCYGLFLVIFDREDCCHITDLRIMVKWRS